MTEKQEAIKAMIIELQRNRSIYSDSYELGMYACDMFDLTPNDGADLPEWLISEAEDIWAGNY
jgi:hypothetical protein